MIEKRISISPLTQKIGKFKKSLNLTIFLTVRYSLVILISWRVKAKSFKVESLSNYRSIIIE